MAILSVSCPEHGAITISHTNVHINLDMSGRQEPFYRFICPEDNTPINKPARPRIIDILLADHCEVSFFDSEIAPGDLAQHKAIEEKQGQLTYDELIDLGLTSLEGFSEAFQADIQANNQRPVS